MTGITGGAAASYVYEGDDKRVKETIDILMQVFVGSHYDRMVYPEDFDDLAAQNWQVISGTWQLQDGGYRQSNTTHTNTFTYYNLLQNQPQVVQWKATYTSGTQAGLYFYASSAAASDAERGNSYRVWQDGTTVKIYESANNVATQRASFAAANAAGQTHSYKVSYDPLTGRFDLWRDGGSLGNWTDASDIKSGGYVSLRTDGANVLFDNIVITRESKYYEAGGVRACPESCRRVAVRHNASTAVNYLLTDHLGSTALTLDQNGARYNTNTELRYMPYGAPRYTAGTTPTSFNFTGQRKDSGSGLLFYNARWYDPVIGRFLAADTLVPSPGNPQALNRYSYVLNNSLKYVDPSGHANVCGATSTECDGSGIRPNNSRGRRSSGQPGGNSGVQAGQSNAGSFHQNDGGGTTAPFLNRLLLPDIYFRGVEAGGGVAYGVGGGVQEVWDFKHKQYALVIAESEMWTTPGAYAVGIIGVGNYGPNAGSIQDYQGRADELTLGAGIPIGVFPANISVTFGTSTNYITQPGSEITTLSFLLGGGTPGLGASWAGTTYEILGEPTTYNSGWDMALGIVEHQISTGALLSPFGRMETPHLVLRALLK